MELGWETNIGARRVKKTLELLSLSVAKKREYAQKLSDKYEVSMLCDLLGLPRSSYYYVPQIRNDQELRNAIESTCLRYPRYGYRRVTPMLKREQYRVGKGRVRLLMGEMDLQVHQRRRKVRTTVSKGEIPYPNLLKGLDIQYPDNVWYGDISYISLMDGSTAYLAILLDIYTRMIRGWSLRRDLSELLTQEALSKALRTGHKPEIHHLDQGTQYTAHSYCARLRSLGTEISMSAKGRAWENA